MKTVILSLYFPYPNNFPPLAFMKEPFHIFLVKNDTILHHLSQKNFWGRTPRPPSPTHLQYQNYHVMCFVERGLQMYRLNAPLPKINLYEKNLWKRNTTTLRFLSFSLHSSFFFFFFFFAFQNFSKVGPPSRKFLDPHLNK